jgi:hypothetical protein
VEGAIGERAVFFAVLDYHSIGCDMAVVDKVREEIVGQHLKWTI